MRQFYGRLGKMRSFAGKTHVHKIPRFRGGGILGFGEGGGCRFYFYGRADFSEKIQSVLDFSALRAAFWHAIPQIAIDGIFSLPKESFEAKP